MASPVLNPACACRPDRRCMFHAVAAGELVTVALRGFDSADARQQEKLYREHNVTRHGRGRTGGGGVLEYAPNSPADQCQCGDCASHRRRAGVTGTADKGKDI